MRTSVEHYTTSLKGGRAAMLTGIATMLALMLSWQFKIAGEGELCGWRVFRLALHWDFAVQIT